MKRMFRYLIFQCVFISVSLLCVAQEATLNIWDGTDCNATVKLTPYLAKGEKNMAIVICPLVGLG